MQVPRCQNARRFHRLRTRPCTTRAGERHGLPDPTLTRVASEREAPGFSRGNGVNLGSHSRAGRAARCLGRTPRIRRRPRTPDGRLHRDEPSPSVERRRRSVRIRPKGRFSGRGWQVPGLGTARIHGFAAPSGPEKACRTIDVRYNREPASGGGRGETSFRKSRTTTLRKKRRSGRRLIAEPCAPGTIAQRCPAFVVDTWSCWGNRTASFAHSMGRPHDPVQVPFLRRGD